MSAATSFEGAGVLPKRFTLLPTQGEGLRVVVASQCVGYVWSEAECWRAYARGEAALIGPAGTLYEAVAAVFAHHADAEEVCAIEKDAH